MQLIFWFKGLESSNTVVMILRGFCGLGGARNHLVKAIGRIAELSPKTTMVLRNNWYRSYALGRLIGTQRKTILYPHRSETGRFVLVHNGVIRKLLRNQRGPYLAGPAL